MIALPAGDHELEILAVGGNNCTPTEANPIQVQVQAGADATTSVRSEWNCQPLANVSVLISFLIFGPDGSGVRNFNLQTRTVEDEFDFPVSTAIATGASRMPDGRIVTAVFGEQGAGVKLFNRNGELDRDIASGANSYGVGPRGCHPTNGRCYYEERVAGETTVMYSFDLATGTSAPIGDGRQPNAYLWSRQELYYIDEATGDVTFAEPDGENPTPASGFPAGAFDVNFCPGGLSGVLANPLGGIDRYDFDPETNTASNFQQLTFDGTDSQPFCAGGLPGEETIFFTRSTDIWVSDGSEPGGFGQPTNVTNDPDNQNFAPFQGFSQQDAPAPPVVNRVPPEGVTNPPDLQAMRGELWRRRLEMLRRRR